MGDFCYGDPLSNKNTVHEHKDEALDLEGASQCSTRVKLREQLRQVYALSCRQGGSTLGNGRKQFQSPQTQTRRKERLPVESSNLLRSALAELFADFLTSGAKVVRAGPSKDLTSVVLNQGSRVFFEVSVGLRTDFFVTTKSSARAYNKGRKKKQSALVYIFNGEDPSKDWEDVFRSSGTDVFDQIVFVWCAYARDLATQDMLLKETTRADKAKAEADNAEKLAAEWKVRADNAKARADKAEKEIVRLKALLDELKT